MSHIFLHINLHMYQVVPLEDETSYYKWYWAGHQQKCISSTFIIALERKLDFILKKNAASKRFNIT